MLTTTWNHIVHKHHLNEDDLVQVWSFHAINPNFNHDNLDNDLNGDLDNNRNDDQYVDNANDDLNDDYGQLHLALVLIWRGDLILKEEGNKGSSSRSNKGREVVGGSSSRGCIPKKFESSNLEKIDSCSPKVGEKDQGTFIQYYFI